MSNLGQMRYVSKPVLLTSTQIYDVCSSKTLETIKDWLNYSLINNVITYSH